MAQHAQKSIEEIPLTKRELECVDLLANGLLNKQIGHKLGISPKTVERHISSAKQKLNAKSAANLAALAVSYGIVSTTDTIG